LLADNQRPIGAARRSPVAGGRASVQHARDAAWRPDLAPDDPDDDCHDRDAGRHADRLHHRRRIAGVRGRLPEYRRSEGDHSEAFMKLLIALVVLFAIAALAALVRMRLRGTGDSWPFVAKKLLSPPEQVLYFRLVRALPDQMVLAQVQLSRFLGVKGARDRRAWLNRIIQLSADFVICAKDSAVLAVIELDDASHGRAQRREADARKTRAVEAAGLRLIRWKVTALPDDAAIRAAVLNSTTTDGTQGDSRSAGLQAT
jgi:very-short-patch-repair endonuclease